MYIINRRNKEMKRGTEMLEKTWFSEVQYVSGNVRKILFANQKEAKDVFNNVQFERNDRLIYIPDSGQPFLLNLKNVEKFSVPKELQEEE